MTGLHLVETPAGPDPAAWSVDVLREALRVALERKDVGQVQVLADALEAHAGRWFPHPHQVTPPTNWSVWALLGGRGTGKTDSGSNETCRHMEGPPCDLRAPGGHRGRIIAPTFTDAVASCVNGVTGLRAHNPNIELVTTKEGTIVRWPSGAILRVHGAFTPEDPERLRSGGNSSLVFGTLIATEHGQRPIETIRPGERVWTRAGLRPVLRAWDHGPKPLWRLTTDSGESLLLTADHKVWADEGWVRCDELTLGGGACVWGDESSSGSTYPAAASPCGHVSCAVPSSDGPGNRRPPLAAARVLSVSATGMVAPVADLSVACEHEFIADGILVSNCWDWYEELAAWRQLQACWDQAKFGLRLGPNPRAIVTTTPKNRELIRTLDRAGQAFAEAPDPDALPRRERIAITRASTRDNPDLPAEVRDELYATYEGTRLGRQELEGEILDDLGTMFSRLWYPMRDGPAGFDRRCRYWDLASTPPSPANEDPDWTVGTLVEYDARKVPWEVLADMEVGSDGLPVRRTIAASSWNVADVIRLRATPAEVEAAVLDAANADGPEVWVVIEQDPGQAGKSQIAHYRELLMGVAPVDERSPSGPKVVRAQLHSTPAQQGRVSVTRAEWNRAWFDEHEQFDGEAHSGEHDDQVDSASGAFAWLEGHGGLASVSSPSGRIGVPRGRT